MRSITSTALTVAALVALTGCDRSQTTAPTEPAPPPPAVITKAEPPPVQAEGGLAIEGEGLRFFDAQGSSRDIPFGTAQAAAIAAVATSTGRPAPTVTTNEECGAGPIQFAEFPGGLQLLFQNNNFLGWTVTEPGLTTTDGMGVGSTRASIESSRTIELVTGSTLDGEFTSGDVHGILSSTAAAGTVTHLWAGLSCAFR